MTSEALDLTPDECPGCNAAILCVQRTRAAAVCDRCGETYLPAYASASPAPARDETPVPPPRAPLTRDPRRDQLEQLLRAPLTRDPRRDQLEQLLRELGWLGQLHRDDDPLSVVPRSMFGGSPLASMIARSNAPDDASAHEVRLTWYRVTRSQGKVGHEARGLLLAALAAQPLPGDPADSYDPEAAREALARYERAPEAVRPTLRLLRGVHVPYTPWEVVVEMAAELAPAAVRDGWAEESARGPGRPRVDRTRPTVQQQREAWGEHLVGEALRWWERARMGT